jgi:hypothetical protein
MPIYSTLDNERKQGRTRRVSAFRQMKLAGVTRFHGYVRDVRVYRVIAKDGTIRELMPAEVPPYIVAHRDTCAALVDALPDYINAAMSNARSIGDWDDLIFHVVQAMDMDIRDPLVHANLKLGMPEPGFRVTALRYLGESGIVSTESMPGSHRVFTADRISRSMGEMDVAPYIWGCRDAYIGMVPLIEEAIEEAAGSGAETRDRLIGGIVRQLASRVQTPMERAALFFPPPVHAVERRNAA